MNKSKMRGDALLRAWLLTGLVVAAPSLSAQSAEQVAAATIVPADIARHVSVLADDSMRGRDTPSPELEATARYVAAQFAAAGLKPGTANGTSWVSRYPIPHRLDLARSRLVFTVGGKQAIAGFRTAAYLATRSVSGALADTAVLVVAGPHTMASVERVSGRGKIVLYVPPAVPAEVSPLDKREIPILLAKGNRGLAILSPQDSMAFVQLLHQEWRQPVIEFQPRGRPAPWIVHVRPDATEGLTDVLAAAGLDLTRLRAATTPVIHELPGLAIAFEPQSVQKVEYGVTAPNVLGKLEGRDPKLRNEYILFIAHMDHLGVRSGQPDSIANGANDNSSGVAGLIALAKVFSQPGMRPRRPILFAAVSGGAKGLWGSYALAKGFQESRDLAWLIDLPRITAALNLDMLGRPMGDTLAVAGLQQVEWPTPPAWTAAAHPELRLTLVDSGTLFHPTSDHFSFSQVWTPSLSFQNGRHEDGVVADDVLSRLDADQAARIIRLVFYVGLELANTDRRPGWTAEGRQQMLGGLLP